MHGVGLAYDKQSSSGPERDRFFQFNCRIRMRVERTHTYVVISIAEGLEFICLTIVNRLAGMYLLNYYFWP